MVGFNRNKGGVFIPLEAMCDPRMNCGHKILFSIILNLSENTDAGCFASDDYFARRLSVGKRQVRRMLKDLEKMGLIERDGTYRRRYVYANRENLNPEYGDEEYNMT